MSDKEEKSVRNADAIRVLRGGAYVRHYRHIRDGQKVLRGCAMCGSRSASVVATFTPAAAVERRVVLPSDGADEEEASAPPSNDWWSDRSGSV